MSVLPIILSDEVRLAQKCGKAVVALESTVISHGLPYPLSIEVLDRLEAIVRDGGAIPATICLLEGKCLVGLEVAQREKFIAKMNQEDGLDKIAIRDIPMAIAQKKSGGTTVSATMYLAHKAGIEVFATGGIGGVHRGWQSTADISMDIKALESIPVIVVCAGAKAILDIPATLEHLESRAVPVYGWQCDEFPSFYSRQSGLKIHGIDSLHELAHSFRLQKDDAILKSGMLMANPIPTESEIPFARVSELIDAAIAKAEGIEGKALTPYLLIALAEISAGETVAANIALLENNVALAAKIAITLAQFS